MKNDSPAKSGLPRRRFLGDSAKMLTLAGAATLSQVAGAPAAELWPPLRKAMVGSRNLVLFQGDSITDAGRKRGITAENDPVAMGNGYAWLAAAEMLVDRPRDGLRFLNRGVSGNKVYQLAERWQDDCLNLLPNVVSILIGVNDFWHTLDGKYQGTVEIYERDFRQLLSRTRKALPRVKLIVCEPFVLHCGVVSEKWFPDFNAYRIAARRVAEIYGAAFVPFQSMFDQASKIAPPETWAADGVHPTAAGAALMASKWIQVVNTPR